MPISRSGSERLKNAVWYRKDNPAITQFLPSPCGTCRLKCQFCGITQGNFYLLGETGHVYWIWDRPRYKVTFPSKSPSGNSEHFPKILHLENSSHLKDFSDKIMNIHHNPGGQEVQKECTLIYHFLHGPNIQGSVHCIYTLQHSMTLP